MFLVEMEGRKDHAQRVTVLLELDINDSEMIQGKEDLFVFYRKLIFERTWKRDTSIPFPFAIYLLLKCPR